MAIIIKHGLGVPGMMGGYAAGQRKAWTEGAQISKDRDAPLQAPAVSPGSGGSKEKFKGTHLESRRRLDGSLVNAGRPINSRLMGPKVGPTHVGGFTDGSGWSDPNITEDYSPRQVREFNALSDAFEKEMESGRWSEDEIPELRRQFMAKQLGIQPEMRMQEPGSAIEEKWAQSTYTDPKTGNVYGATPNGGWNLLHNAQAEQQKAALEAQKMQEAKQKQSFDLKIRQLDYEDKLVDKLSESYLSSHLDDDGNNFTSVPESVLKGFQEQAKKRAQERFAELNMGGDSGSSDTDLSLSGSGRSLSGSGQSEGGGLVKSPSELLGEIKGIPSNVAHRSIAAIKTKAFNESGVIMGDNEAAAYLVAELPEEIREESIGILLRQARNEGGVQLASPEGSAPAPAAPEASAPATPAAPPSPKPDDTIA